MISYDEGYDVICNILSSIPSLSTSSRDMTSQQSNHDDGDDDDDNENYDNDDDDDDDDDDDNCSPQAGTQHACTVIIMMKDII